MIIPYGSDAPVYHRPLGTIGLILVNVLVFFAGYGEVMDHGDGLHPIQWVTSMFSHMDIPHLVGNMIFLWAFGLIVEGKIGSLLFLAVYMAIGVGQSCIEQICMLGASRGGSLGASSAIFGIMACAWLWAPKNLMDVFVFIFVYIKKHEWPVWGVCLFFIGWDVASAILSGGAMGTSMLHVMGAVIGAACGYYLLTHGKVNCEGWDLLTIMKKGKPEYRKEKSDGEPLPVTNRDDDRAATIEIMKDLLQCGYVEQALQSYHTSCRCSGKWDLPEPLLRRVVQLLVQHKQWAEVEQWGSCYVERYTHAEVDVRMSLVQAAIQQEHPTRAHRYLQSLNANDLDEKRQRVFASFEKAVAALFARGVIEFE